MDEAKKTAESNNEAYALLFCTEDMAKYTGEGTKAVGAYKLANRGKSLTMSVFDASIVEAEMKKAGINTFVKIPAIKANEEHFKKYSAGGNTLVICAPNGDKLFSLSGDQTSQTQLIAFLKTFKTNFESWKNLQKNKKS